MISEKKVEKEKKIVEERVNTKTMSLKIQRLALLGYKGRHEVLEEQLHSQTKL